jgi:hypothetical protein
LAPNKNQDQISSSLFTTSSFCFWIDIGSYWVRKINTISSVPGCTFSRGENVRSSPGIVIEIKLDADYFRNKNKFMNHSFNMDGDCEDNLPRTASTLNLEEAGLEAALEDGVLPAGEANNTKLNEAISKSKKAGLRRGKWTAEEESYANRLIHEFKLGLLPLTDGTTLRTFLSKLLNCDPMRISKKFVGGNCIGKVTFTRANSS